MFQGIPTISVNGRLLDSATTPLRRYVRILALSHLTFYVPSIGKLYLTILYMRKRKSLKRRSRRRSGDHRSGVGKGAHNCCEADPDAPANIAPEVRRQRRRAKVQQDLRGVQTTIANQSAVINKLDLRIQREKAEAKSHQALGDTRRRDRSKAVLKQTRGQRRNLAGVRSATRSREAALLEQLAQENALEAAAQAQAVLDATEGEGDEDDVSTPSTSDLYDSPVSSHDDAELEAIGADLQGRDRPPSLTSEEQRDLDDFIASTKTFDIGRGATRRRRKRSTRKGKRKGKRSTRKKKRSRRY